MVKAKKNSGLKVNGGISLGNMLVIITMIVTVTMAWTSISSSVDMLNEEIDGKADEDVVTVKFEYIQHELEEIKDLIKERKQ